MPLWLTRAVRALGPWRVAALVALLLTVRVWGTTYYVRTVGLDTNNGLTAATAFKTLTKAISAAQAGDVVYVGAGTYTAALTTVRSGTAAARIRFVGDSTGAYTGNKGRPTLQIAAGTVLTLLHDNIDFEYFAFATSSVNVVSRGNGNVLRTCTLRASTTAAVSAPAAGSLTLTGCTVYSSAGDGIVNGGTHSVTVTTTNMYKISRSALVVTGGTATLDRNTIYTITRWAAEVSGGTATLTNNLVRGNTLGGISMTGGTVSSWHNTFYQTGTTAFQMSAGTATLNNCILCGSTNGVVVSGGTLTHRNNLYYLNTTNDTGVPAGAGDLYADPKFVNPASNWSLQNSSPAIDMGTNASAVVTTDRAGNARPRGPGYDIGAYEITGPSANVPYFTDFEAASTPGTEWTSATATTVAAVSRFAGKYSAGTLGLRVKTTPGVDYSLIFDVYLFDTWDGDNTTYGPDYFSVGVDGATVSRGTYASGGSSTYGWPDSPEICRQNLDGSNSNDGVFRRVRVDFTAANAVSFLTFTGENLQGVSDESWGVDNVRVIRTDQATPYSASFVESGRLDGFRQNVSSGEGAGIFVADYNADGVLDAVIGGGATSQRLLGAGGAYTASTLTGLIRQAGLADFTGDRTPGLIGLSASGVPTFYTGLGATPVATDAGTVGITTNEAVAAADLNGDGLCDAAFFSGSGNFALIAGRATPSSPITWTKSTTVFPNSGLLYGDGDFCSSGDVNNDGFPDFFYHYGGGELMLSRGDGTYAVNNRGISVTTGAASKMGSAWADFNNDGWLDLFVAKRSGAGASLWVNPGATGNFTDQASARGISPASGTVGCCWGDFDDDGDLDLFVTLASGQSILYVNSGAPGYTFTADLLQGVSMEGRGGDCVFADFDNDGNLDLAVSGESTATYPTTLFLNQRASANFLLVRVVGSGAGGINTLGVGSRVELWDSANTTLLQRRDLGAAKGYGGQEPLVAHFGGINPDAAYTLRVINGHRQFATLLVPSGASTTIGSTVIPQMYTAIEPTLLRVTRWRTVSADE